MKEHIGKPGEELKEGALIGGRYEIVSLLGTGGMGSVYLVKDRVIASEALALKLLHPEFARDPKHTQRFLREVQLMRKVNHHNVVRTYDVGADNSMVYFTMEFISGKPFDNLIDTHSFPKDQLSDLIIQTCEGLEAIHQAGIIHRDLKPGNLMLCDGDIVKIADFGVARPEKSDLTAHNEIVGSASYMAPELWLGKELTGSIDLYALGVILYEIATGEIPFDAESPAALMALHLNRRPTPPREVNSGCPAWLDRLIVRLLQKRPSERYHSANEVIRYVERYQHGATLEKNNKKGKPSIVAENFIASLEQYSQDSLEAGPQVIKKPERQIEEVEAPRYTFFAKRPDTFLNSREPIWLTLQTLAFSLACYSAGTWCIARILFSVEQTQFIASYLVPILAAQIPFIGLVVLTGRTKDIFLSLCYSVAVLLALNCYWLYPQFLINEVSLGAAIDTAQQNFTQLMLFSPLSTAFEAKYFGDTLVIKGASLTEFWQNSIYGFFFALNAIFIALLVTRHFFATCLMASGIIALSSLGLLVSSSNLSELTLLGLELNQPVSIWYTGPFVWAAIYIFAFLLRGNKNL